jgi:hypothetical protein
MRKNLLQRWWNAEHAIVSSANESLLFSQLRRNYPLATQSKYPIQACRQIDLCDSCNSKITCTYLLRIHRQAFFQTEAVV